MSVVTLRLSYNKTTRMFWQKTVLKFGCEKSLYNHGGQMTLLESQMDLQCGVQCGYHPNFRKFEVVRNETVYNSCSQAV